MRVLMLIVVLAVAGMSVAQDAAIETPDEETIEEVEAVETEVAEEAEMAEEAPAVDAYAEAEDIMLHLCMECHGDFGHDAGFKLPTTREGTGMVGVPSIQRTDLMLIDLEKPESSYLIMKLRDDDGILGKRMPIVRSLSEEQLSMFDLWVAELSEAYLASLEPEDANVDDAEPGDTDGGADDGDHDAGDADDEADVDDDKGECDDHDEDHE